MDGASNLARAVGWQGLFVCSYHFLIGFGCRDEARRQGKEGEDRLLEAAGLQLQNIKDLSLGASLGVVVRDFPLNVVAINA